MRRQRGTTLIELMVALVVGMLVAVGVFSIMALAEGRRRATTTVNTLNADGQFAAGQLERWLRSVGSGLSSSANFAYGCKLIAGKGSKAILPLTGPLPEPFGAFKAGTPVRMAPVVIWPGQSVPGDSGTASDVLAIMNGGTGGGALPVAFDVAPDAKTIYLKHHGYDFVGGDLLLVADAQSSGVDPTDCTITQVQKGFTASSTTTLPLDGDLVSSLSGYSGDAVALNLGNMIAATGAQGGKPRFMLVGVGEHSTLFTYDLLQSASGKAGDELPSPVAGGVLEMHAIYGIGNKGDGKVNQWVAPVDDYAPAKLLDGSALAASKLRTIKAIRVGLILRTTQPDRVERPGGAAPNPDAVITATAPTLFADPDLAKAGLTYTRDWGGANAADDEQMFRYRTIEVVLPLRNAVMVETP